MLLSFFVLSAPCLAIMVLAIGLASLSAAAVSDIAMKNTKLNNRMEYTSIRRGSFLSGLQLGGFTVLFISLSGRLSLASISMIQLRRSSCKLRAVDPGWGVIKAQ